jgi:REP element-mobilizing transposase RayT
VNWQKWFLLSTTIRNAVLTILERAVAEFEIDLVAWTLMANHIHLVVRTPDEARFGRLTSRRTGCRHTRPWPRGHLKSSVLAQFMHKFRRAVSGLVQAELGLKGRFWESSYGLRTVQDRSDLVCCMAYLHRNPVKEGMVTGASDYAWSSAACWEGRRAAVVPLVEPHRLPFGFEWNDLRARVMRRQGDPRVDVLYSDFERGPSACDTEASRTRFRERLREAGLDEGAPCGNTAAPAQR